MLKYDIAKCSTDWSTRDLDMLTNFVNYSTTGGAPPWNSAVLYDIRW